MTPPPEAELVEADFCLSQLRSPVCVTTGLPAKAAVRSPAGTGQTILYCTIPYYTILYYAMLCYTIIHYTILYYTILHYYTLYYTVLYYTLLLYTILYYRTGQRGPQHGRESVQDFSLQTPLGEHTMLLEMTQTKKSSGKWSNRKPIPCSKPLAGTVANMLGSCLFALQARVFRGDLVDVIDLRVASLGGVSEVGVAGAREPRRRGFRVLCYTMLYYTILYFPLL